MRPILLHSHERSLTKVVYNKDGDLILSTAKDSKPNVWFAHNGERLGSLNGHNGAVWDICPTSDSTMALTASADASMMLWNLHSGKQLFAWLFKAPCRCVDLYQDIIACVTDQAMGQPSTIHFLDIKALSQDTIATIVIKDSKVTTLKFGYNGAIFTGHEDGTISKYDSNYKKLKSVKNHSAAIQDIQFSSDKSYFITASKDNISLIFDSSSLSVLKTFKTNRPVNSASISPIRNHIILGGGQEAMKVTTTSQRHEKFEVRVFHEVFQEEIGRIKGHFGPINTLSFSPDGKSFASGGEDGYIRIHHFDADYFDFKFEEEEFMKVPAV